MFQVSLLALQALAAQQSAAVSSAETQIVAATVFRQHALITRRAELVLARRATTSPERIVLRGFPANLDPGSIQASCSGASRPTLAGLTLLPDPEAAPTVAPEPAEVEKLRTEIQRLDMGDRRHQEALQLFDLRTRHLRTLEQVFEQRIANNQGSVDLSRWLEDLTEVEGALETVQDRRQETERAREQALAQRALRQQELAKLTTVTVPPRRPGRIAELSVLAARPGATTCELRYMVGGVSWSSEYDARLDGGSLALAHHAWVDNRTGEDWEGVRLSLSTADVSAHVSIPAPTPQVLRVYHPQPPVSGRGYGGGARYAKPSTSPGGGGGSINAPSPVQAPAPSPPPPPPPEPIVLPSATVMDRELFAVFTAGLPATVPTQTGARRVYLTTATLTPDLEYVAVPRRSNVPTFSTVARHGGERPLLAGPVRLFLGDDYVGRTQLEKTIEPGKPFRLAFGRDERVHVERVHHRRDVRPNLEKELHQIADWVEIRVRNRTGRAIAIDVLDQHPVSPDAAVTVKMDPESTRPGPALKEDPPGTLRWKLKLADRGSKRIQFGYQVTYPIGRTVVGL